MSFQQPSNILLAEHDPAMARLLSEWLTAAGYRVRIVRDGREALAAMEAQCPQILIADSETPQVSVLDVCRWVRSESLPRYVYTIITAAADSPVDAVQGLESGADDFLRKPIDRDELLARLRAGLRVLELESRLLRTSQCDSLTGLYTQRTFYEALKKEWARSRRHNGPIACVMIDIDYFKRINDTYGHGVGDEVIRRVARLLEKHTRTSDVVSRYGGEEFCVLLPECDERHAVQWAERMRKWVAEAAVAVGKTQLQITASFGVAQGVGDTGAPEELVDMADQALLVSKRLGRDRVTAYQTMNDSTVLEAAAAQSPLLENLAARDVMTTIVAGLPQHEKIGRAVEYFLQLRINSAPVVDEEGRLVGVVSEKDAMTILLLPRWWETTIADVMKKGVITYEEDTPALTIYEFLCRVAIRSIIVVRDGKPVGVISRASLLRWFTNALVARGEARGLGHDFAWSECEGDVEEKIAAVAAELRQQARRLEDDIAAEAEDLKARVVGGASRIQEFVNDLLGYSRFLQNERLCASCQGPTSGETVRGLHAVLGRVPSDDDQ